MWKMAGFTWQVLKRLIGLGCFVVVVMGLMLWGLSRTTRLMGMGGPRW